MGKISQSVMQYDLFICHASEDKDEIVRPLAERLAARGRKIWLDELEIKLGDSLRQRIDHGLANSRFALVVLSPAFFAKQWPQWELDGLAQREMLSRQKVVLPIWHRVTSQDVAAYSLPLAGRRAALTEYGLDAVVEEIDAVFAAIEPGDATVGPLAAPAETASAVGEPYLVLAPPSQHHLDDPHQVTAPPQVIWAQTAFVQVENVGGGIAFIRNAGADPAGVGTVTVRPPTALAAGAVRPVELVVSTMTPDVRLPAGQLVRFWLDYGDGAEADRRLWAVARYDGGGGWSNVGSDNRLLAEPEKAVVPRHSSRLNVDEALARVAFASAEVQGGGASLKLRRWVGSNEAGSVVCAIQGHLGTFDACLDARPAGGGWVEYAARFPDSFDGAGVAAGHHSVRWTVAATGEELALDEFRFP